MNDYFVSLIRTVVPVAVGSLLGWLAVRGFEVPEGPVREAVVGLCIAGYYAAVRAAERRWPALGVLLGRRAEPVYPAA